VERSLLHGCSVGAFCVRDHIRVERDPHGSVLVELVPRPGPDIDNRLGAQTRHELLHDARRRLERMRDPGRGGAMSTARARWAVPLSCWSTGTILATGFPWLVTTTLRPSRTLRSTFEKLRFASAAEMSFSM